MKVRAAEPAELEEVFMMGYDAWGADLPVEMYLDSCLASYKYKQGQFYVLEDDYGRLLSSCIIYPLSAFGGCVAERAVGIGSLATPAPDRHRGFATFLVATLMERLEGEGVDAFFIFSDIHPRIYENLGFAPAPERFRDGTSGSIPMLRLSGDRDIPQELWQELVMPSYF